MKLFIVLIAAAVATALPLEESSREEHPRFVQMPDSNGVMQEVDLDASPDYELLTEITRNPANNLYLLFTRQNSEEPQSLELNNAQSILNSNFDASKPVAVLVHGWLNNQESNVNSVMRDAFLAKNDVNVIILEWRRLAISGYVTAVSGVPAIGTGLGQFLEFLSTVTGAPLSNMHIVGFSLGAHVAGNAGRYLRGEVGRITGLDPAGPLWHYNSNRLAATDAIYVEGIHTDGGYVYGLGIGKDIGDADFYPNGGTSQPLCITPVCDHNRAWRYFAASITYNHLVGNECTSSLQMLTNRCRGQELHMGNDEISKSGRGTYRVNTSWRYPY